MTQPKEAASPAAFAGFYEQIIESMTSAVVAVDLNGVVVTANSAACAHLGVSAEVLCAGVPLGNVPAARPLNEVFREMQRTGESVSRREIRLTGPEGRRIIGLTTSLLKGPEAFNGVAFLFTDLTRVRELERAAELNRRLAQIGEITAGVVHEFRNPLSVISGMSELIIRRAGEDAKLRRNAEAIFQEARQLERLVGQFLTFARPFELETARCAPEEILDRAEELCSRLAAELGVRLSVRNEAEPPYLCADWEKISQALSNLVRNAIEMQEEGGGWVDVLGKLDGNSMVFRVEDGGPGIKEAAGQDLFEPFVTMRKGGTGLGLTITHRIVSAHGGDITYGNIEKGGAWFEIRLPLEPSIDL